MKYRNCVVALVRPWREATGERRVCYTPEDGLQDISGDLESEWPGPRTPTRSGPPDRGPPRARC